MYNIKGPSKMVAKAARRGISQNYDNVRDNNRNRSVESDDSDIVKNPRPIFHKKTCSQHHREDAITPQHEEIIKFITESWNSVCSEDNNNTSKDDRALYYEDEPCPLLNDFKPFDLESWWGKRLYSLITNSVNVKN